MSVLKLQGGLRGVNPQSLACNVYPGVVKLKNCREEEEKSANHQPCVTTITRCFSGDSNSTGKPPNNVNTSIERLKGNISSLGNSMPLKMVEFNKFLTHYLASTSKKLSETSDTSTPKKQAATSVASGDSPSSSKGNSNRRTLPPKKAFESAPPNCDNSFEDSVAQMNLVSFYDTSCATNTPFTLRHTVKHTSTPQDLYDDEIGSVGQPVTIGPLFPMKPMNIETKKKRAQARRAEKISRLSLESRTKALVLSLRAAHSLMSKITRAEELCEHLINHPECVWDASSVKTVRCLKELTKSPDKTLRGLAYQNLSLIGYAKPMTAPGIRILSIDGGGTRGLVTIEFLKALEKQTGRRVHELFDYVCGVSTGALLAILVCLYKLPLDRCEELYKECATHMFTRNRLVGTSKLVWNYGFYDSNSWEDLLCKEMGEKTLIEFARESDVPKLSAVSSLMQPHKSVNHLFRTYNPPPGAMSQYVGSCKHKVWQAVRASSAAPGYFESFKLGDGSHEDGGVLTNNPTALAIHEGRLLWPNESFHCVVSLGTGRHDMVCENPVKMSLKRKISTIVESATDTEAVHQTLQDLLPARTYFRFNPYLSEDFLLDEIRPEKMTQMQHDAQMYTRRNSYKLSAVSERLMEKRKPRQVALDWMKKIVDRV